MAENPLESKMDGLLENLKSVEKTVNDQLEVLSTSVDESFGAISEMVEGITALAVESSEGFVSAETRAKIGLVGVGIAAVTNMAGNVYKARQRNAALDRLLQTKQAMARAKADELKKVEPILIRVLDNLKKGIVNEAKHTYPIAEVGTPERWDLILDRMDKYLDMYRTSIYLAMVVDYLQAEYTAWLSGKQISDRKRPDYYAANKYVVSVLEEASGENALETFIGVFEDDPEVLSGSTVYYLMDSQLSATILSKRKETDFLLWPDDPGVNHIIEGNAAIDHYQEGAIDLETLIEEGPETCWYSYKNALIVAVPLTIALSKHGHGWLAALAIIAGLVVGYFGSEKNERLQKEYENKVWNMRHGLKERAWQDAGKVEFPERNLEKTSLIKAAFFGA